MREVAKTPWNGLVVASTFSGCGGSCLGYRMAGFRVAWANEFVPAAQNSYKANFTDTVLDPRDIHGVEPTQILKAMGLKKGELDLLDGSPPCQAFSTAGLREKGWGKKRRYEHGAAQRNETLFEEYIRILRGLMPRAFIAENVSGLVKGTAKGFFLEILAALKKSGYAVRAALLDAQWLGVPQTRSRVFFIGFREDLGLEPRFPKPLPYRYSLAEALPHLQRVTHDTSGLFSSGNVTHRPSPCISFGQWRNVCHFKVVQKKVFGDKTIETDETEPDRTVTTQGWGSKRAHDVFIRFTTGFSAGKHRGWKSPCPSVNAQGLNGSGHGQYRVCEQGTERRLTIDELKAICSFPQDFILTGSYIQQWERLGNSVPPLMAAAVGKTVAKALSSR